MALDYILKKVGNHIVVNQETTSGGNGTPLIYFTVAKVMLPIATTTFTWDGTANTLNVSPGAYTWSLAELRFATAEEFLTFFEKTLNS